MLYVWRHGASGVAPLAKAIREVYPDMQIAEYFGPYFKTTRNGAVEVNDIVNSSDFGVKCKICCGLLFRAKVLR